MDVLQPVTSALLLHFRRLLISGRSRSSRVLYKNMGNIGCPGPITELSATWLFAVTFVTSAPANSPQMLYRSVLQLCNSFLALPLCCYNLLQTVTICYIQLLHFVTIANISSSINYKVCNNSPLKNP